jgi:hypothetical protein
MSSPPDLWARNPEIQDSVDDPRVRPYDTIHSLPNELLVAIFKAGSLTKLKRCEIPFPLLVSSICRYWRDVTINTPDIWTNIHISMRRPLKYTLVFLERSKSSLLDITINVIGAHYSSFIEVSNAISSHIYRTRRLVITAEGVEDVQCIVKPFHHIVVSNLEYLHILVRISEGWSGYPFHFPLVAGAVQLRSLKLEGVCSKCSPPLVGLTNLDILRFQPNYGELRDLFSASPSLTKLVLRKFGNGSPSDAPSDHDLPIIETFSLRYLAISFNDSHSISHCQCTLSSLSMPNLEYLEIVHHDAVPNLVEHFSIDLQKPQYLKLQTLRLQGLAVSDIDVTFFRALPMIKDLELIHISSAFSLPILTAEVSTSVPPCESLPWQHLRSITVDTLASYDNGSWLCDVVTSRVAAGCRLFTVHIRPTYWEEVCTLDDIKRLRELAEVEFVEMEVTGLICYEYCWDEDEDDCESSCGDYDYDKGSALIRST